VTGGIDVAAALARRDELAGHWDDSGQIPWLDERGVELVRGRGRLAGDRLVAVTAPDGSTRRLRARRAVVVAPGSSGVLPPVPGLAEAAPWGNREVTALTQVPRRLLVLGGGAIGAEMAQAIRRLGADEVTIVEAAPRLLANEEPFAGDEHAAAIAAEGIDVVLGRPADGVHRPGPGGPVTVTLADGWAREADELLVAAGRRPATADLGLNVVGLEPGKAIEVDDRLRATGVPEGWLYAVGDANGRALLTHMGKYQARVAADVILGRDTPGAFADHHAVPHRIVRAVQAKRRRESLAVAGERRFRNAQVRRHSRARFRRIRDQTPHVLAAIHLFVHHHIQRTTLFRSGQFAHYGLHPAQDLATAFQPVVGGLGRQRAIVRAAIQQQLFARQARRTGRGVPLLVRI
jgi:dihydrolipoamide dehydrogenase